MTSEEQEFRWRSEEARAYATLGLTGLYIVHGGAITAILTSFSTVTLQSGLRTLPAGLVVAAIAFSCGIALTLGATVFASFAAAGRAPILKEEGWKDRMRPALADFLNIAAKVCGTVSLIAFIVGATAFFVGVW